MSDLTPKLELKNITRRYGGVDVVRDVSLSLADGDVTCLLGPSGCGKSTTLRMTCGVDRQTSGEVWINGNLMAGDKTYVPAEGRNVGLMFQDFALFPHLDVVGNVGFGLRSSGREKKRRIQDMLDRVGLIGFEKKYPHQLSGGEQQRVALARALAPGPDVMLMDEPFSGLDDRLRDEVREATLDLLRAEGSTVLMVTHDPDEALRTSDQIALMRYGEIVQCGGPYNIYTNPVDRLAAGFFSDINIICGRVKNALVDTPFGAFLCPGLQDGTDVEIVIRPQHLKLDFDREGRGPNATATDGTPARGRVKRSRFVGSHSLVEFIMDHDGSTLHVSVPNVFMPKVDTPLWLSIRRDRCFVFPV